MKEEFFQPHLPDALRLMEEHRDDLVVIVSGYQDRMTNFLAANPGLASRFPTTFTFPDDAELATIFESMATAAIALQAERITAEGSAVDGDEVRMLRPRDLNRSP